MYCVFAAKGGGGGGGGGESMDILCALKRKTHVLCFQNSYKTYTFGALRQRTHTKNIPWKMNYFSGDFTVSKFRLVSKSY